MLGVAAFSRYLRPLRVPTGSVRAYPAIVADDMKGAEYPQRAALLAELCKLWKAARRPLPAELNTSVLDGDGWDALYKLADLLALHLSFEYLDQREIRDSLVTAVKRYKRPD